MIKKLMVFLLVVTSGFILLLNGYVEARSLDDIKQSGFIKIAIRINNPPMGLGLDSDPQGIDPDMARMLARELGVKPEWKILQSPKEREKVLLNKEVDLVISSFSVTPERLEKFDFSNSYYATGLAVMILAKNKGKIREYQDLEDKRITVTEGSTGQKRATELLPSAIFVSVKSVPETYEKLRNDEADAIVNDYIFLKLYAKEHPEFYVVENLLLTPDDYAVGIGPIRDKDNQELVQFVNTFITTVKDNDKLNNLIKKYIEPRRPPPLPEPPDLKGEQIYTVKEGDTLSKIARDFYENPTKWETIFQANADIIKYPAVIKEGWKLKIPSKGVRGSGSSTVETKPMANCKNLRLNLDKLRRLYDRNLISKEIYEEKQREELVKCPVEELPESRETPIARKQLQGTKKSTVTTRKQSDTPAQDVTKQRPQRERNTITPRTKTP